MQQQGPVMIMQEIQTLKPEEGGTEADEKFIQMLELCMCCLRNITVSNTVFRDMLETNENSASMLPECL